MTRKRVRACLTLLAASMTVACGGSSKTTQDDPKPKTKTTDAGSEPEESAPVTYPPLDFTAIGTPVDIAKQFLFTEGPVWDPEEQVLYFTDINADAIFRLTLPDTFDVLLTPMGWADGLALDPDGNLIGAGYVSRNVWRLDGSELVTLTDAFEGKKLNSPDDLTARSDGIIYFTDPTFGISGSQGFDAQPEELGYQGIFRLMPDGTLHLEDQSTDGPNGVQLSPDEKTLYVAYTSTGEIHAYPVAEDGSLGDASVFATDVLVADSMCADAAGNLYVASLTGITVLDPSGANLGVIPVTGEVPTNATFGGPDLRTLFITARTDLVDAPTPNNSSIYRVDDMPIPGIAPR